MGLRFFRLPALGQNRHQGRVTTVTWAAYDRVRHAGVRFRLTLRTAHTTGLRR
jgi:hypothetical protein